MLKSEARMSAAERQVGGFACKRCSAGDCQRLLLQGVLEALEGTPNPTRL